MEEQNKKLRKWRERAVKERKKVEKLKEEKGEQNFLNTSYESWSDLNGAQTIHQKTIHQQDYSSKTSSTGLFIKCV